MYQSFTFTIPISPMFAGDTKVSRKMAEIVDRQLTLSYQSLLMLQSHGFDLGEALGQGVPYLSREELKQVTEQLLQPKKYERIDPSALKNSANGFYTDIPEELTVSAEGFYSGLAEKLREWLETKPIVVSLLW